MALNAKKIKGEKKTEGSSYGEQAALDAGAYPGRLVQVIDLGIQPQRPFKGEDKPPHQTIHTVYELSDEFVVDNREESETKGEELEDKPRWVFEELPLYNLKSERAKSTKRYNSLDPEHEQEGDWEELIKAPCLITLTKTPGSGDHKGKFFNNVANTAPVRPKDAAKMPDLKNDPMTFNLDNPDDASKLDDMPEWLANKIKNSIDFASTEVGKAIGYKEEDEEEEEKPAKKKRASRKPKEEESEKEEEDNNDENW